MTGEARREAGFFMPARAHPVEAQREQGRNLVRSSARRRTSCEATAAPRIGGRISIASSTLNSATRPALANLCGVEANRSRGEGARALVRRADYQTFVTGTSRCGSGGSEADLRRLL